MARRFGKIGTAKKWCAVGREEHRQRPAARTLREHLMRGLVDLIQIRALFAVHLDIHEQPVHDFCHRFVLKRFMRHDMTPVAGRVTDGEQNRPVFLTRLSQRLLIPWLPCHRVMRMLQQIRRGGCGQTIAAGLINR